MGIVHHSNHVRYFELGRIAWLREYDQPYERYVEAGFHFATIRVEVDYHMPARFADEVVIQVWADTVRHASLRMAYNLCVDGSPIATGHTEHAAVDTDGKVRRLPSERRDHLASLVGESEPRARIR